MNRLHWIRRTNTGDLSSRLRRPATQSPQAGEILEQRLVMSRADLLVTPGLTADFPGGAGGGNGNGVSAHWDATSGVLTLTGDDGANRVTVHNGASPDWLTIDVTGADGVNASLGTAPVAALRAIRFDGGAGRDTLVVGDWNGPAGSSVTVSGDDVVEIQGDVAAGGSIAVLGDIVQVDAGASLHAPGVSITGRFVLNAGTIDAPGGTIAIQATSVQQAGTISADRGAVAITASKSYVDVESARTLANAGGITIDVGPAGRLFSSGEHTASSGNIRFLGADLVLVGARLDASGVGAGGTILVGGDRMGANAAVPNAKTVYADAHTLITADAIGAGAGQGGKVVVWGDDRTEFYGSTSARGAGSGGGGFIEVSSKNDLTYGGFGDASSRGAGPAGTLLLDPKNLTIDTGNGQFPQYQLIDPTPSAANAFGAKLLALPNGNIVVADSLDDTVNIDAGAVYVYNGLTGALISTLSGGSIGDSVGSGGLTLLSNGNFVVSSPNWDATDLGAVTWAPSAGLNATVTAANSLVGLNNGDAVGGGGVIALTNGNYAVGSPSWNDGFVLDVGAATWRDGTGANAAVVSNANSLIGTTVSDGVGTTLIALSNGNYAVGSPNWDGGAVDVGAVTWRDGTGAFATTVTAGNSLTGTTANDLVGLNLVALTNGNYVVGSPFWTGGAAAVGAATWRDGTGAFATTVTAGNSLTGTMTFDLVGFRLTALSNGNYVVGSPAWDNGGTLDVGAATWVSGAAFTSDTVTAANSLIGATTGDFVGGVITALSNGNYAVGTPNWDNGATIDVGAATWRNGTAAFADVVGAGNSLIGAVANDLVGSVIGALSNGNYVVGSPNWDNAILTDVGAATLRDGTGAFPAAVTAANSIIGATIGDQVGTLIRALPGGAAVILSPSWINTALPNAGAATWIDAAGQTLNGLNTPDKANSIIGDLPGTGLGAFADDAFNNSFVVGFAALNGGRVNVGFTNPSQLTFARGEAQTVTVTPDFLTRTLNTGTSVILQASNDITINSSITVNNPGGNGGDLTLRAGRSINFAATTTITTDNGNLTLIANDLLANGVVNAQRDAGAAAVNMAFGPFGTTINAGAGQVTISVLPGTGKTNLDGGDIQLGTITAAAITVNQNSPTAGSEILLGGNIATTNPGGNITLNGATRLTANTVLNSSASAGNVTVNGTLEGAFDLTVNAGAGSVAFTGNVITPLNSLTFTQANNITTQNISTTLNLTQTAGTGNTSLQSVTVGGALALTTNGITLNNAVAVTGTTTLTNAGLLNIPAAGDIVSGGAFLQNGVGAVNLAGDVTTTNAPATFTSAVTLTGPVTVTTGTGNITFAAALDVGGFALTLSESNAADLGTLTTLNGGSITAVNGVLLSGAAESLVGVGAVNGPLNLANNAEILPGVGANAAGTVAVTGPLSLQTNAAYQVDLNGTAAGQFDQLDVIGTVDVTGAALNVTLGFAPAAGDSFVIIDNDGVDPVTGTFVGLPEAAVLTLGGNNYRITYLGGTGGNDVTLTRLSANNPPTITPIPNQTVAEGSLLTVNVVATDPDVGDTLTYSLDAFPIGATIDPTTGVFTWTPTEAQGPGLYPGVTVRVTDAGGLFATASFDILVTEVNQGPVLTPIAPQVIDELTLLSLTVTATDADLPANILLFSLDAGAPLGATITPDTGIFSWVPDESQGPGVYNITIRVTDSGGLFDTTVLNVTVNEVNLPPVLAPIGPFAVDELMLLTFTATATDPDLPPNTLTFSLDPGFPAGAAIDPTTGVFTWTPTLLQGPMIYTVTIRVTDNGVPSLSGTTDVIINVGDVQDAPVLLGANPFTPIDEDQVNNPGTLVSDLIAGQITDTNPGDPQGIAVTAANTTLGAWEYTLDGGTTWLPLGAVTDAISRLLAADALTRVRFVPAPNINGTINPGITFRAWDQFVGQNGDLADTRVNGGATAFSSATAISTIVVNAINDAPVITVPTSPVLINAGGRQPFPGVSVADVDAGNSVIRVTLLVTAGALDVVALPPLNVTGNVSGALVLEGTLTQINFALSTLAFTTDPNFFGPITLTVIADDLGNTGAPGPLTSVATVDIQVANRLTTVDIVSSADPAVFGQDVRFTATVTARNAASGVPQGTVQFFFAPVGGGPRVALGAPVAASATDAVLGSAVFVSPLFRDPAVTGANPGIPTPGAYEIVAVFTPTNNVFDPNSSAPAALVQDILAAATLTVVTVTPNPSVVGAGVTLTANVTPILPGAGVPTGNVEFFRNGVLLGAAVVTNGVATLTNVPIDSVGNVTFEATYSGDGNFLASAGTVLALVNPITIDPVAGVSLGLDATTVVVGQTTTIRAQVQGVNGLIPTGSIIFFMDNVVVGMVKLDATGSASQTISRPQVGTNHIQAVYQGDARFNQVIATPILTLTTNAAGTTLSPVQIIGDPNPTSGSPLELRTSVSVIAPGVGAPTGRVAFRNAGVVIGYADAVGGIAALPLSAGLPAGTYAISAEFVSDTANFLNSTTAGATPLTVVAKATTSVLTVSSATSVSGQAIELRAAVSAPSGTVRFLSNGTLIGEAPVIRGVAVLTTALPNVGAHALTAEYVPDKPGKFAPSVSTPVNHTVALAKTSVNIALSTPSLLAGNVLVVTAKVQPLYPGAGSPTGSVEFFDGFLSLGSATLVNGVAVFSTTNLVVPKASLIAVYHGDARFDASTSTAVSVNVGAATGQTRRTAAVANVAALAKQRAQLLANRTRPQTPRSRNAAQQVAPITSAPAVKAKAVAPSPTPVPAPPVVRRSRHA